MHHANLDRIWATWQKANGYHNEYNGIFRDFESNRTAYASLDDPLTLYSGLKVGDIIQLGYGEMCYTYDTLTEDHARTYPDPIEHNALAVLPPRMLRKHFPRFAAGNANRYHSDMQPIVYTALANKKSRNENELDYVSPRCHEMPHPKYLTRERLLASHFNVERGLAVQQQHYEFIKALNSVGYCSPYI